MTTPHERTHKLLDQIIEYSKARIDEEDNPPLDDYLANVGKLLNKADERYILIAAKGERPKSVEEALTADFSAHLILLAHMKDATEAIAVGIECNPDKGWTNVVGLAPIKQITDVLESHPHLKTSWDDNWDTNVPKLIDLMFATYELRQAKDQPLH